MKWAALGTMIAVLVMAASAFASAGGGLTPFLLRSGEEPGFHAGKPESATSKELPAPSSSAPPRRPERGRLARLR